MIIFKICFEFYVQSECHGIHQGDHLQCYRLKGVPGYVYEKVGEYHDYLGSCAKIKRVTLTTLTGVIEK